MARNREAGSGNNPDLDDDNKGKNPRGGDKSGQNNQQKSGENSAKHLRDGMKITPESLSAEQDAEKYAKLNESAKEEIAFKKTDMERMKVDKEWREAQGLNEQEIAAQALNKTEAGDGKATEKNVDTQVEVNITQIADNIIDSAPQVIVQLQQEGRITPAQTEQMQAALQAPATRGRIKNFFHRMKDSATWGTLGGLAASVAVKGGARVAAIGAFGTSLPVILGVGAAAGGGVEAVRSMWRESKKYEYKDNIAKLENEPDQFKKAALLNKLEEAYNEQKISGSPEDLRMAGDALVRARTHLEAYLHSQDTQFEKETDKDKLMFLLRTSDSSRKSIDRSTKRETKQLLKDMERSLSSERKFSNLKGRWGKVGWATLRGASFGTIGAGVGYAVTSTDIGPNAWNALKGMMGYSTEAKTEAIIEAARDGKSALLDHEFTQKVGARGVYGAGENVQHDFITQMKTLDPNYAKDMSFAEQVHLDDRIKDLMLERGVDTGSGVVKLTGSEIDKLIQESSQLSEAKIQSIEQLIKTNKHFISEATKLAKTTYAPGILFNPDNDVLSEIAKQVQEKIVASGGAAAEAMFTGDRAAADIAALLITNALVEEGLDQGVKKVQKDTAVESGFRPLGKKPETTQVSAPVGRTEINVNMASGPAQTERPVNSTETPVDSKNEAQEGLEEKNKFFEKTRNELQSAGIKIQELGFVFDDTKDLEKQRARVTELVAQFIESFKKNSNPDSLQPLILEFNFKKDSLSDVEARPVSDSGNESIFLRIPTHHKKAYYNTQFKDFFSENSVAEQPEPEVDNLIPTAPEVNTEPEEEKGKEKSGHAVAKEELMNSHNFLKSVEIDRLVYKAKGFDAVKAYKNINDILTKIKESGRVAPNQLKKVKNIKIATELPDESKVEINTLYIKAPFGYRTVKEKTDIAKAVETRINKIGVTKFKPLSLKTKK